MLPKVVFVLAEVPKSVDGRLVSDSESVRRRVIPVAQELGRRGFDVRIEAVRRLSGYLEAPRLDDTVFVVAEQYGNLCAEVAGLRMRGARVFVDLGEDRGVPEGAWSGINAGTDGVTVPSTLMAERIREQMPVSAVVVPDCVELSRGRPRPLGRDDRLHLLWMGRGGCAGKFAEDLADLTAFVRAHPCALEVVCDDAEPLRAAVEGLPLPVTWTAWTPAGLGEALARSDAVLLADAMAEPLVREVLWAGRPAVGRVAKMSPDLAGFAVAAETLAAGLEWLLANPEAAAIRVRRGQAHVGGHFTPERIADIWERICVDRAPVTSVLRLNLGCGDKHLEGYLNVDIAPSRAGVQPDVICDLQRPTTFAPGGADEILAVHVIEHFWYWEVVDILRAWVDLLRPGGRMILECPNLRTACERFLADPVQGSRPDAGGRETMWVFYGDPRWRDPLMVHRWGYTPESLAAVMRQAGLVDLVRQPARFKAGEPRDMRIVGRRPLESPPDH